MKKRKGNLVLVTLLGTGCAVVITGMLRVASNLFTSTLESAETYSNIQTYRAATEVSCYSFVKELCGLTAQQDMSSTWLSSGGNAFYLQTLDEMVGKITESDLQTWKKDNLAEAISGASVQDQAILTELLAPFAGVNHVFEFKLVSELDIDWSNQNTVQGSDRATLALKPFAVEVYTEVASERLFEEFLISGLYLDVEVFKMGDNSIAQFRVIDNEEGVSIEREAF